MSHDKKEQKSGGNPQTQLYLIGLLLLVAALHKSMPKLKQYFELHKITIELAFGMMALLALALLTAKAWNWYAKRSQEQGITKEDETSVFMGKNSETGKIVHLKQSFRTMHTQVIGTTNAGKTESVILPWAIQDIKNGSGVLIIDGKSDASFVNKLYSYVKHYGREKDFQLFSLANPGPSSTFNPLKGRSAQEVTERVFSSFTFDNPYYKNIQYKMFLSITRLIYAQNETPTFSLLQRLLTDADELGRWIEKCPDEMLKKDMVRFLALPANDREERVSGLETMLSYFTSSDVSILFEETEHAIDFDEALKDGKIVYFQLPTMYFPILASVTGKLVLQCFQNAVSKRQIYLAG